MTRFLGACRYLLAVPVVGCVMLTAAVVVMGMARIVVNGTQLVREADLSAQAVKAMAVEVIEIIDLFLFGTVAYITAVGLYKLFISKAEVELPIRLKIHNLKDLEDKIIGVIVAALAVAFLGKATGDSDPEALMHYGAGVALVITALAFFTYLGGKESGPAK